jgi:queuine tRNA-ribosyltransferase
VLKIDEEGVTFRSYRDGSKVLLTAETSVQAQKELGADIIIPFDELPPYHIDSESLTRSFERTHRWMKRSLDEHERDRQNQAMYAVCHGGMDRSLREKSCSILSDLPFDGFALGGSLGKTKDDLIEILKWSMPCLDPLRPVHLLGIGDLESIERSLPYGIDTFDSSYPTKAARHGIFFTKNGKLNLFNSCHKEDLGKIDETCRCHTCQNYSRGYISHLFKAKELTAYTLATIHNLTFMVDWMEELREKIALDLI